MKTAKYLKVICIGMLCLLGIADFAQASPASASNYSGELNGIPIKAWLWWNGDDVVGFLDRVDGKPMTIRLAGENRVQGKMTLKGMQGYGDIAILRLSRSKQDGVTIWNGTAQFKDGLTLPVTFKKL